MPWRESTGWWCCNSAECKTRVHARIYETLDNRRLISVKALPDWMHDRMFRVQASAGNNMMYMKVMNFPHTFNAQGGGRLCLTINRTPNDIYIDMCTDDHAKKKRVPLRDLYETNPEITEHGQITLRYPKYVSTRRQENWVQALESAFQVGQDMLEEMNNHPLTLTDDEDEEKNALEVLEEEITALSPRGKTRVEPTFEPLSIEPESSTKSLEHMVVKREPVSAASSVTAVGGGEVLPPMVIEHPDGQTIVSPAPTGSTVTPHVAAQILSTPTHPVKSTKTRNTATSDSDMDWRLW